MSLQGRPKGEFPPGGTARQRQGSTAMSLQGRPKGEFPPGVTVRSAEGAQS